MFSTLKKNIFKQKKSRFMKKQKDQKDLNSDLREKRKSGKSFPANKKEYSFNEGKLNAPEDVLSRFSRKTGHNFSAVKLKRNSEHARKLGVKAFTHGNDIHFGQNDYAPNTTLGRKIISHELMHVVQQSKQQTNKLKHSDTSYESHEKDADAKAKNIESADAQVKSTAPIVVKSPALQAWGYKDRGFKFWKKSDKEKEAAKAEEQAIPHNPAEESEAKAQPEEKKAPALDPTAKEVDTGTKLSTGAGAAKVVQGSIDADKAGKPVTGKKSGALGLTGHKIGGVAAEKIADAGGSVMGSASAVLGLTSVGKATKGVVKDFKKGKFDSEEEGGVGKQGMLRSAGRGVRNAASVASAGLSVTKTVAKFTGNTAQAAAMGKAIPGLGIATGTMDAVSGGYGAFKAHKRKKMVDAHAAKMEKEGGNEDQVDALKHISEIQAKKRKRGMAKAALGVGSAVAAGLALNPLTAPAGLVLGGAIALGKGGHAIYKKVRQDRRDKYAEAHENAQAGVTPEMIKQKKLDQMAAQKDSLAKDAAYKGWNPLKAYKASKAKKETAKLDADSAVMKDPSSADDKIKSLKAEGSQDAGWNPLKHYKKHKANKEAKRLEHLQNYGTDKKAEAEKLEGERLKMGNKWYAPDISKSSKAKEARNEKTVSTVMGMDKDSQSVALGALGLNKYKKGKDGKLTDEQNRYYKNRVAEKKKPDETQKSDDRSLFASIMGKGGPAQHALLDKMGQKKQESKAAETNAEKELITEKLKQR